MKYMNCYCECYINFHVHDCTEMSKNSALLKSDHQSSTQQFFQGGNPLIISKLKICAFSSFLHSRLWDRPFLPYRVSYHCDSPSHPYFGYCQTFPLDLAYCYQGGFRNWMGCLQNCQGWNRNDSIKAAHWQFRSHG